MPLCSEFNKHHNQRGFVNLSTLVQLRGPSVAGHALGAAAFVVGGLALLLLLIANAPQAATDNSVERAQLLGQASAGEPSAQRMLGLAYRDGRYGLVRDPSAARDWLHRAAKNGDRYAATQLEQMNGTMANASPAAGDPPLWTLNGFIGAGYRLFQRLDPSGQSIAALRRRAESGDAVAQFQLAIRYRDGALGLERDPLQARHWLQRSAAQGNTLALRTLAAATPPNGPEPAVAHFAMAPANHN